MTTAKETRDQYNILKSDLGSKLSAVQEEKRKTEKSVVNLMKFKGEQEAKYLGKEARADLTKKFKEENKDLIDKYNFLSQGNKLNENNFQAILKAAEELNPEIDKNLLRELIMGEQVESKDKTQEKLLNKPDMTAKDKVNMEKSIKFLVDNNMDTSENLKKLEAINYGSNYIEIGGVKRARENLKAEPNKKNIFKHGDEVYFKFDTLKEQNKLLAKQGMEIPGKDNFVSALKALPGEFAEDNWYVGGNILGNILDLSMSGCCNSDGKLFNDSGYGYVWSSSERDGSSAWGFKFNVSKGRLNWDNSDYAFAVRPVLK